jgi:putative transposase
LSFLHIVKRRHVAIWNWIQKYLPQRILSRRKNIAEFILDETQVKVGSGYIWIWVAIEPKNCRILALSISKERNMLIAERFLSSIVEDYGKNIV